MDCGFFLSKEVNKVKNFLFGRRKKLPADVAVADRMRWLAYVRVDKGNVSRRNPCLWLVDAKMAKEGRGLPETEHSAFDSTSPLCGRLPVSPDVGHN